MNDVSASRALGWASIAIGLTEIAATDWLQEQLGLRQHPEKTRITHWRDRLRFLGYDLGCRKF